jgi:hypothetical protein
MLVQSIQIGELPDVVVFIDVGAPGDPGKWAGTYRHVREVVIPLCSRHGIEFVWIDGETYPVRDARSLFASMWARGQILVAGRCRGVRRRGVRCRRVNVGRRRCERPDRLRRGDARINGFASDKGWSGSCSISEHDAEDYRRAHGRYEWTHARSVCADL